VIKSQNRSLKSVRTGDGIPEEGNPGRMKGGQGEKKTDQQKKRRSAGQRAGRTFLKESGFQIKGNRRRKKENGDVEPVCRNSQNAGVGIV